MEMQSPSSPASVNSNASPQKSAYSSPQHQHHPTLDLEHSGSPYKAYSEQGDHFAEEADEAAKGEAELLESNQKNAEWIMGCYIALGAIAGVLLRIVLAQIFGEECNNPGTIGYLKASTPLCVTGAGETTQEDGIIFPDLPSNMLGSLLMGFFASGATLGLTLPLNIAWVSKDHPFQKMTILHKAFTTGFCGSLTTFSSWNSEMVVMAFGTGGVNRRSQVLKAVFGYIIGMETAVGSYVCGQALARLAHKWVNPMLHEETKALKQRKEEGVHLSTNLPDFERRFLPELNMHKANYGELLPMERVDRLEQWRASTANVRRVRHPNLAMLTSIETTMLVDHRQELPSELERFARNQNWDVDALQDWVAYRSGQEMHKLPSVSTAASFGFGGVSPSTNWQSSRWFSLPIAAGMIGALMAMLLTALFSLVKDQQTTITYRTMVYAMLFAPLGAISRWQLSKFNGKLSSYPWFPAGTFAANIIGSVISILMVALEYRLEVSYGNFNFWSVGSIRAVRIGLAGCLTTVSTFVSEVHGFLKSNTNRAYPYTQWTLATASVVSGLVYGMVVYVL